MPQTTSSRHCPTLYPSTLPLHVQRWERGNPFFQPLLWNTFISVICSVSANNEDEDFENSQGSFNSWGPQMYCLSVSLRGVLKIPILEPYLRAPEGESSCWGLRLGMGRGIISHGWCCQTSIWETDDTFSSCFLEGHANFSQNDENLSSATAVNSGIRMEKHCQMQLHSHILGRPNGSL